MFLILHHPPQVGELFLIDGLGNKSNSSIELTYCWQQHQSQCDGQQKAVMAGLARLTTTEVTKRTVSSKPASAALTAVKAKDGDSMTPPPIPSLPQPILKSSQAAAAALTEFRRPLAPAAISSQQQLLQQQEQAKFRQQLDLLVPKVRNCIFYP